MRIDSETFETALHEARHAAFAASRGMPIHEVFVTAEKGHTLITLPFQHYQLRTHWTQDPARTMQQMVQTIGMIVAPVAAIGDRFSGRCGDADMLGQYARWWGWLPSTADTKPAPWLTLVARARVDVWRWATAPGCAFAQDELACWLARAGTVDAEQWAWLWAQPFAQPLHQRRPAVSTQRRVLPPVKAAVARPTPRMHDAPLGAWDTAWFETHRKQARVVDVLPVPSSDWRTGFMPGLLYSAL